MDDGIDHGRRHLVIAEHHAPPAELQVRGDDHRLPLVGVGEHLEEQPHAVGVQRQEAELVDGEQPRAADERGLAVEAPLVAGSGTEGDMSSVPAYFATVLRLTPSLIAISARGTLSASIDRISFIMSRGTAISSILPGRARQSLRPGTPCGEGRAPGPRGGGPHALSAQFSMTTMLKKRWPFGPVLSEHQHGFTHSRAISPLLYAKAHYLPTKGQQPTLRRKQPLSTFSNISEGIRIE